MISLIKNKKGSEERIFFLIFELIVLAMLAVALIVSVRGLANGGSYWKKYYANDLAMIVYLEHAAKGDMVINYKLKDQPSSAVMKTILGNLKFQIELQKSAIYVYQDSKEEDRFPINVIFGSSKDIIVEESSTGSDFIVISKKGDSISLRDSDSEESSCLIIDTQADTTALKIDVISDDKNTASTIISLLNFNGEYKDFTIYLEKMPETSGNEQNSMASIEFSNADIIKSEKMACFVGRELNKMGVKSEISKYPEELQTERVEGKFIVVKLPADTDGDAAKAIADSILNYYK